MDHEEDKEVPHEAEPLRIAGYGSTFKLQFRKPLSPKEIKSLTAEFINTIEERLMKRGAKGVGHIKLYIKGRSGYLHADTLGSKYGIHIGGSLKEPEVSVLMTVNTIALGTSKDYVFRATRESIENAAIRYDFLIEEGI